MPSFAEGYKKRGFLGPREVTDQAPEEPEEDRDDVKSPPPWAPEPPTGEKDRQGALDFDQGPKTSLEQHEAVKGVLSPPDAPEEATRAWGELFSRANDCWDELQAQKPGDLVPARARAMLRVSCDEGSLRRYGKVLEKLEIIAGDHLNARIVLTMVEAADPDAAEIPPDVVRRLKDRMIPEVFNDQEARGEWVRLSRSLIQDVYSRMSERIKKEERGV